MNTKGRLGMTEPAHILWSGRKDLNLRPPAPHAGALPGCATPRRNRRDYSRISCRAPAAGGFPRAPAEFRPDRAHLRRSSRSASPPSRLIGPCSPSRTTSQSDVGRRGRRRGDVGLEPMARAVDRESLLVEEVADAADQQHLVVLVIAAVAAALDRLQLRELLLPIAEHVRLDRTEVTYLADREIPLGGDGWKLGLSSTVIRHGSQLRPWPSVSGLRGR